MKKIALGILSVFMLFGGVVLSACSGSNPSLSVSSNYIEICTNDADMDNYQSGNISVTLEGSNDGIGVQVESGSDVVTCSVNETSSSQYTVTFSSVRSGNARARIYSRENQSVYEYVNIQVYTVPTSTSLIDQNDDEGRTSMYVVKGGSGTSLNVDDYISFEPADANVKDVVWSFNPAGQDVSTQVIQSSPDGSSSSVVAEIRDNMLYVNADYQLGTQISVYAILTSNISLSRELTFQVIDDSFFSAFSVNGNTLIGENDVTIDLVRNNSSSTGEDLSVVSGWVTVETFDEKMTITPRAFLVGSQTEVVFSDYFNFTITGRSYDDVNSALTINFNIDAQYDNTTPEKLFGNLYFDLVLNYSEYTYSISSREELESELILNLSFIPTSVVVRDSAGNDIGGNVIDLYSQYYNSQGYLVYTNVYPDDVPLSNSSYRIRVDIGGLGDVSINEVIQVFNRNTGVQIEFQQAESSRTTYITEEIANGTSVYLRAGNLNGQTSINGLNLNFEASDNSAIARETLICNLYRISMGTTMEITEVDEEGNILEGAGYIATKYLSSARNELGVADSQEYYFRISGISSIEGLSLQGGNNRNFTISMEEYDRSMQGDVEQYVIVKVTVSLNDVEFRDYTSFSFSHRSGLSSRTIMLEAFTPLSSASVYNDSRGANNIYDEASESQNYMLSGAEIIYGNANESLSSILVSAGSNVSLLLDYQNATLNTTNTAGYQFYYLDSTEAEIAEEDFVGLTISDIVDRNLINNFINGANTYYTFSNGELSVRNIQFTIFIMVQFYGYDENHDDITIVRFFKLESFYPVTSLRSDIADTELLSWETLSNQDEELSQVDVSVTLRNDDHPATYADLSYFKVILGTGTSYASNSNEVADITLQGGQNNFENMVSLADVSYIYNDYLLLTNFRVINNELRFNIRAQSTKLQSVVNEIVSIQYTFKNSVYPEIINVNITQVDRVEEVVWLNETTDSQIYLNVASDDNSEKTFTINTSVGPSEAYNKELSYYYQAMDNNQNILQITTSSIGQTFTLSIRDNSQGGWGYLYLLPSDMIKIEGGVQSAIIYNLVDGEYEADYLPLDEIHTWYIELINGENGRFDYFLNNNDERVYYRDIILQIRVTVSDGRSENTAIRVYSEEDFWDIKNNPDLYYRIMNDITLSNWESSDESFDFSGMIFGNSDNVTINLNGQSLTRELSGVIKDLTIQGASTSGAFVANVITGDIINISSYTRPTVENVNIDVVYDNDAGSYTSSVLSGSYSVNNISYAGAIASVNAGVIRDCKVYGVTMNTNNVNYVGGVAGYSYGTISGVGVEFYNFAENTTNTISGNTIGGVVGYFGANGFNATITDSYVYAFNLNVGIGESRINSHSENISATREFNALAGTLDTSGTNTIETSFAFMGDYTYLVAPNSNVTIRNSYITYYVSQDGIYYPTFSYYNENAVNYTMPYDQLATAEWSLDSKIWETENISSEVNFGYAYLKDVTQTPNVSVEQTIKTVEGKSLAVDDGTNGILFYYNVRELITNDIANGEIRNYNTISVSDLFGITEREAESLLVSVNNQEYAHFSNSTITTQRTTDNYAGRLLTLSLISRTDFSNIKTYNVMILDAIPAFVTTTDGAEIRDNQIINIQTGIDNAKSVNVVVDDGLYLYGERYTLTLDDYIYTNTFVDDTNNFEESGVTYNYLSAQVIGNTIVYEALNASENNYISANISLGLQNLNSGFSSYASAIRENNTRTISISSYDGANSLVVDSTNLSLKPMETTSFNAILNSDNASDGIDIEIGYQGEVFDVVFTDENNGSVIINDNLMLDISITKLSSSLNYHVLISVNRDYRHRVDTDYNLTIYVRPQSQRNSDNYLRTINLLVQKQTIEDVNVVNYMVSGRQLRGSTWYYLRSEQITSTITPGTETILTMEVNPNFAHMTNFSVSYTLSNASAGSVSLSRLLHNLNYGYYVDTSTTQSLTSTSSSARGLMVTPTDSDLRNGIYYFRLYVSSSFSANSVITVTFTFYDGAEILSTSTNSYSIDYLQEASVLVNGETSVMLAKSQSAHVTVDIENDQILDRIYLNGHGQNITLTDIQAVDHGSYTTYSAYINTSVLSTLANGESTGAFTVEASVVSYVNGIATYKYSYATIYLVDFTVDAEDVSIATSDSTMVYGGQEYDAFNTYINASSTLSFNYQINPESYNYNTANIDEVNAVNAILANRTSFLNNGTYADVQNSYYINYRYNELNRLEAVSLRERLFYVNSNGSATPIYNSERDSFLENSTFDFSGGASGNAITIKGKQSGSVLLRLETYVIIGNSTFVRSYDFVVSVSIWSDEEVPTPIYTASEFLNYLEGNPDSEGNTEAGDYILMNDIVLTNYSPSSTEYFNSLDGNGYTIYLNSYNFDNTTSTLNLALFSEVTENSTIKNVRVNIYNGGKLTVNINQYSTINIAGFTLENNGIIYNCDVVAFYDVNNSLRRESGATGLVVNFVIGNGGQPTDLTTGNIAPENINIAGFALSNNNVITNSRVGGETYKYIREEFDENFYDEMDLPLFTVQGQGYVAGFVSENSGTISASFASNIEIVNSMRTTLSQTAGFVRVNSGEINTSYVKGEYDGSGGDGYYYDGSTISTTGNVGGFAYYNNGTIKNSYINYAIEIDESRSYLAAGFVYENDTEGIVTLSFAQVKMSEPNSSYINNMYFSGVDQDGDSLNSNPDGITFCYYFADERDVDIQSRYEDVGAYAISRVDDESIYYRFSFTSVENAVDGIWTMLDDNRGITLASADHIAFSNRYIVYHEDNEEEYDLFYSTLRDYNTRAMVKLAYGSFNNPIIIRDAEDFAKATGRATEVEVSSYSQYYNDNEVFGNYRFVSDIDFSTIDQNLDDNNSIRLTTTTKDFSGILDGNGFTITNMILEASDYVENYGLFARINGGSILNLGLEVASVHNGNASIVGTLAGTVIDGRIMAITLNPVSERDEEDTLVAISIHGNNIVGGVVGAVFGNSKLSDIIIEDIDVAANYYDEYKGIDGNALVVGDSLKSVIEAGGSIRGNVSTLSYAGGLAGYVDIYEYAEQANVVYSGSVDYSTYDIMTVRIYNSINIYGEVAGGIIGYMSGTTIGYDLGLELDADMGLTTPSYITAKNLYAGGIVGESYGGLFACYAEYSRTLQDTIEENMYSYYNGASSSERGQLSIFSYTAEENDASVNRYNDPYYAGGLVGYAGGGYITTSYNRLNVVSNNSTKNAYTSYFGGIVGGVNSSDYYNSEVMLARSQVSYFLDEVYFSGVLNSTSSSNTNMGGAIGYISTDSIVGLKKVNTIPYFELDSNRSKIFALIGGFETEVLDGGGLDIVKPSHLYFLDNMNGHYDLITGNTLQGGESVTTSISVSALYLAQNDVTENDLTRYNYVFGFRDLLINVENPGTVDISDPTTFDLDNARIMQVEWMRDLPTMELAYTRMNQYFLRNDWNPGYWEHEVNTLYPRIVLTPRTNVMYLDAYEESIAEVLEAIENTSSLTIVVRGMIEEDNPSAGYTDVDLREYLSNHSDYMATNFTGTFVSYEEYMNATDAGTITLGEEVTEGGNIIGGTSGENVGLILDRPLFRTVDFGFEMRNLNLYYTNEGAIGGSGYSSLLVANTSTNATFDTLDIHLNSSITLSASVSGVAGLLTAESVATDFLNINIIFRRESERTTTADIAFIDSISESSRLNEQYFGILAGRMTQNSIYKSMTISNINFAVERIPTNSNPSTSFTGTDTPNITVDFEKTAEYAYDLYFGLLAGDSTIEPESNTSTFRMTSLNRYLGDDYTITVNLTNSSTSSLSSLNTAYVGSYFGRANFTYIEGTLSDSGYPLDNITINQGISATTEYLGLGFGQVYGGGTLSVNTNVEIAVSFTVAGNLNQNSTVANAYIGGFIGQASVNSIEIDNTVATNVVIDGAYRISTTANLGALIGDLTGAFSARSFNTTTNLDMVHASTAPSRIDVVNFGLIGTLRGTGSVSVGTTGTRTLISNDNIKMGYISGTINIGGVVGSVQSTASSNAINIRNYINNGRYNLYNCDNMVIGGVVGNSSTSTFDIRSSGFGGMLYVLADNGDLLSVGGIVGVARQSESQSTISRAYSYGDVFVNYVSRGTTGSTKRLESYSFGGAVGRYEVEDTIITNRLSISNSYSLMSSFNSRITENIENYNVNAFVGFGSGSVAFAGNYYASGVTFALQTETGNTDTYYSDVDSVQYYGYSLSNDNLTPASTSTNIISEIRDNIVGIVGSEIKKLNPTVLTMDNIDTFNNTNTDNNTNTEGIYYDNSMASSTPDHVLETGINWFYLSGDLGGGDSYVTARIGTLNNAVIVGNGQTINFMLNYDSGDVGENVDTSANAGYGFIETMSTGNGTFSAVSNLVIHNTLSVVTDRHNLSVGGLVGLTGSKNESTSILYAVGVNGDITVGGRGNVVVGGIVGDMQSGAMINNAYFDGDIYYSAGLGGQVNGISHSQNYLEIFNTFSAGSIQTLFSQNGEYNFTINLFNNSTATTNETTIYDSYTIMQHISRDYGAGVFSGRVGTSVGNNYADNFFSDGQGGNYASRSVGYGGISYHSYSLTADRGAMVEDDGSVSIEEPETRDLWFYSPYKNYGYATTGFGFLRNVTIASRETTDGSLESVNYIYTTYSVEQVAEIAEDTTDYFYPILNSVQFSEMLTMSISEATQVKDMQYMLRYDITLSGANSGNFATDREDKEFILDGRNNTLTFTSNGNAIFETIYGTMENMQIVIDNVTDKEITSSSLSANTSAITDTSDSAISIYGSLANEINGGTLNNISVEATMNITDPYKIVGGVVGVAVNSNIKAVESLVGFTFGQDQSNSIVGGVVGYAIGSTIEYSSNASNIRIKDGYARASTSKSTTGDDVTELFEEDGYDLPVLSYTDGSFSTSEAISITTSNKNNGTDSGTYELTSSPSVILGGVVGVAIDGGSVDYSYNTASIINGYEQFASTDTTKQKQVGTVISGGVVGYADGVEISNSFNAGYVVSGNMYNTCKVNEVTRGYPALAGGIVGYTTGSITDCFNDAKVQAVSYLDKSDNNYDFSITRNSYRTTMLTENKASIQIEILSSMQYNIKHPNRIVFAYALGYVGSDVAVSGGSGDNAEIVNDGNIGHIFNSESREFTLQRYGGVTFNDDQYQIDDYFTFYGNDSQYKVISGYDSYGFPNRYNYYYEYTFDMNILEDIGFWTNHDKDFAIQITISDTKGRSNVDNIKVKADPYSGTDAVPGGTTEYYLSIPFYNADGGTGYDGYSYEEYVYRLNHENSVCNKTCDPGGDMNAIYDAISEYTQNNTNEKKYNIAGTEYSVAYNGNQLAAYTRGVSFSDSLNIGEAPSVSRGGENVNNSGIRISSMTFDLYNNTTSTGLEPLSYSAYVTTREGGSYLNYTVYYDKDELCEAFGGGTLDLSNLNIDVTYDLVYTFRDGLTLTKNNIVVNDDGNRVTFQIEYIDSEGNSVVGSFGNYFNSLGISDIQDDKLQVEFEGITSDVIEPFIEDGAYYIGYDCTDAYIDFDNADQRDAFLNALDDAGDVTMTYHYYMRGTGDYESADLVSVVTNGTSDYSYTYPIGLGNYIRENSVPASEYVTLTEGINTITLTFDSSADATIGAVRVATSYGDIIYYPYGIDSDKTNKFLTTLNTTGTGVVINTSSTGNYVTLDFSEEIGLYSSYSDALSNGNVYTAELNGSNSIIVPATITRTINDLEITYALNTTIGGFTFDLSDSNYIVTPADDNDATTFTATYTYESADLTSADGQVIFDGNVIAIVGNTFTVGNNEGEKAGIRDGKGATYEFSSGKDTLYGLNSTGESYVLTSIRYNGNTINIYRFASGREIKEYVLGNYSYLEDGSSYYVVDTTAESPTLNTVNRIDERMLFINSDSAFANFSASEITEYDGNLYLVYYGTYYMGDFGSYIYNGGSPTYNNTPVSSMIYMYALNGGNSMFRIAASSDDDITDDEIHDVTFSVQADWFEDVNFYFVATDVSEVVDDLFTTQTITFDENRLVEIINDDSYEFDVKQYGRTLANSSTGLYYGNSSALYSTSGDYSWSVTASSYFNADSSGSVTLNNATTLGEYSGSVTFTATLRGATDEETRFKFSELTESEQNHIIGILENDETQKPNIIIANNIYYNGNMMIENFNIYGDGHIINVFGSMSNWQNLIEINGGSINNTKFVFAVDLGEYAFDVYGDNLASSLIYLGVYEGTRGNLSDISLYGSIRNINSNTTTTTADGEIHINDDARNKDKGSTLNRRYVYLVFPMGDISAYVSDITSYMTMQGNSAKENTDIVVRNEDDADGTTVSVELNTISSLATGLDLDSSYIVLGDGANGSNGVDGPTPGTRSGSNGGNGGNAGKASTPAGKIFHGANGVGGNGGNGADGRNAQAIGYSHVALLASVSTGGGGGGAYGSTETASITSNRRSINAFGGSGGTGGLGVIYYNATYEFFYETRPAIYSDAIVGRGVPSYYYNNGENVSTFYITAAGGGSAGIRIGDGSESGKKCKGDNGKNGITYRPDSQESGVFRGSDDDTTRAYYGYVWIDHHHYNPDEYLFGNLQFIPVFSDWTFPNASNENENASIFGVRNDLRSNWDNPYNNPEYYRSRLENYIQDWYKYFDDKVTELEEAIKNGTAGAAVGIYKDLLNQYKATCYDEFNWSKLFYGGAGGRYSDDVAVTDLSLYGGTPYTSEIYGYLDFNAGFWVWEGFCNKYFFTRNDMVTSGGSFGTAKDVTNPFDNTTN